MLDDSKNASQTSCSHFSSESWLSMPALDGVFPFPSVSSHLTALSQTYFAARATLPGCFLWWKERKQQYYCRLAPGRQPRQCLMSQEIKVILFPKCYFHSTTAPAPICAPTVHIRTLRRLEIKTFPSARQLLCTCNYNSVAYFCPAREI